MKRNIIIKVSIIMLALIIVSVFTACGDSDNTTESSGQEFVALTDKGLSKSVSDMENDEIKGGKDEEDINESSDEETEESSETDTNSDGEDVKSDEINTESADSVSGEKPVETIQNEEISVSESASDSDLPDENSENTSVASSDSSSAVSDNNTQTCAHNYGQGVIASAATCTKDGTRIYTCSKCGAVKSVPIPATGHTYETSVSKEATCGTTGVCLHKCSVCGDSYTTTINATGNHVWQPVYKTVHHDAKGHYEIQKTDAYKCNYSGCNETFATVAEVMDHIELIHNGHASYSVTTVETQNWVQDSSAYDEQVVDYYKCSVCGEIK